MPRERPTVLFFSSFGNLRWGGQKSIYHLATRVHLWGYRAQVAVPCEDGLAAALREKGIGVSVLDLPPVAGSRARDVARALAEIDRLIRRRDVRILHTDGPRNTFYAGIAALVRRRPLVWHIRASAPDAYDRLLFRLSSRVVLVANALRGRFDWTRDDRKFRVIHNGVDTREFQAGRGGSRDLLGALGIDGRRLVIASLARVEPSKGQAWLIEACAALRTAADFHLVLAGEIADRAYAASCRNRAADLGIGDRVSFPGHLDEAARFLREVDLVAVSSVSGEAFPRTTIEAMSAGKPVLVTSVGGAPEAVEDGETGYIVMPGRREDLGERLLCLARDPGLRERMGSAARRRAEALFSIEANVAGTASLYKEILGRRTVG